MPFFTSKEVANHYNLSLEMLYSLVAQRRYGLFPYGKLNSKITMQKCSVYSESTFKRIGSLLEKSTGEDNEEKAKNLIAGAISANSH